VDLRPGHYTAQVRASLDGEAWSPAPAAFAFAVLPPWYARPWVLALAALLLVAGLWAAHRARVAGVLRLERERTRIAMDLHDELGSGLGSIGILSGVLAADRVPDTDRQALAREIAAAAEELGASLSDIIWALEPRAATLEELASRLVEHGGRLFAGEGATFVARMPRRWPPGVLSLTQRRSLLLIGLEALHNVARHAGAREVTLTLAARDGDAWELRVEDDGRGLGDARSPNGGRGLPGMGRRAEEIGGHIEWRARPGGGTIVALRFGLIEGRGVARPHLRDVPSGVT
jgi:signal transduction histidine kinase